MKSNKIKFVDLFAGIGGIRKGFELALENSGLDSECVFSSEIDERSQKAYALNFDETPSGDIREIDELPPHDLLLAGFPCQTFSYAGKQRGFADTRGTLFFEIERLISKAKNKPKLLLLENVRGFVSHDKGRTYETVVSKLKELGYRVSPLLLNSSNFGVPQNRVRIYLVCSLIGEPKIRLRSNLGAADSHKFKKAMEQPDFFSKNKPFRRVLDILENDVEEKYHCKDAFVKALSEHVKPKSVETLHGVRLIDTRGGNSIHSWDVGLKGDCTEIEKLFMNELIANRRKKHFGTEQDGKKLTLEQIQTYWDKPKLKSTISSLLKKGYLSEKEEKYNPVCGNMSFEVFKFLDPNSISITVVSSDAHKLGVVHNGVVRRITPRECARLQGFPDYFKLYKDDRFVYKQLGNSVSVPVIETIFRDMIANEDSFFMQYKHPKDGVMDDEMVSHAAE